MLECFERPRIEVTVFIHGVHLFSVLREVRTVPRIPILFHVIRRIEDIRARNFKVPALRVV